MKYRSILALGLCLATMHLAAMEEQGRTDYSQGTGEPRIVTTSDAVEFKLSPELANKSTMLKELAELGVAGKIPIQMSAKTLGNLLELVQFPSPTQENLDQNLSFDDLINLLKGADYLGLTRNDTQEKILSNAIIEKITWKEADLAKLLNDPAISEKFRKKVIIEMAYRDEEGPWNKMVLKDFYAYKSLPKEVKLFIIKELIKSQHTQLMQFVDYERIRKKECAEDPRAWRGCIIFVQPTDEDKDNHSFIKNLVGDDDYKIISDSLKEEYPE